MKSIRLLYKQGNLISVIDDTLIVSSREMTMNEIADHIEEMTNYYHRKLHFLNERQGELIDGTSSVTLNKSDG